MEHLSAHLTRTQNIQPAIPGNMGTTFLENNMRKRLFSETPTVGILKQAEPALSGPALS